MMQWIMKSKWQSNRWKCCIDGEIFTFWWISNFVWSNNLKFQIYLTFLSWQCDKESMIQWQYLFENLYYCHIEDEKNIRRGVKKGVSFFTNTHWQTWMNNIIQLFGRLTLLMVYSMPKFKIQKIRLDILFHTKISDISTLKKSMGKFCLMPRFR